MKRKYSRFDEGRDNSFRRNLLKPQIIKEASRNKVDFSDNEILARQKSEKLVEKITSVMGLRVEVCNVDELEYYSTVYRDKDYLCIIHKYWNDPVLHIQNNIKINRLGGDFRKRFRKIHDICAMNFLAMLFPPVKSHPEFEIVLQMGICEYGFNKDVMKWALTVLNKCRRKISPLLKSKMEDME